MREVRKRNLQENSSRERRQSQRRAQLSPSVVQMAVPKKKVKKSVQCEMSSNFQDYSKIPLIPQVKLTIEQMMKDPIELIVELQRKFQQYGAVKLIAPPEWKSPFCFNYGQIGIKTRVQHIHKLKYGKAFKENEEAYNVRNFQGMALGFQKQYKFRTNPQGSTRQEKIQSEYWNIVNDGQSQNIKASVQYAADLPVTKHGSGFPLCQSNKSKDQNFNYFSSLFNLNNLYKSPNSILKIADSKKEYISGVTTPWVYMGMMFSSFCWHVEDLWLNSVNYNHKGGTKTWYIIPRKYKQKFDSYVKEKTQRDDLLDRITFMLDPLEIMKSGIPVYKANQNEKEYVCTFFKAYHAGFSHGFNVGEAVNFISPKSLQYIQQAMSFISQHREKKPAVLSYDWLVYQNKIFNKTIADPELQQIINVEYQKILKNEQLWIKSIAQKYTIKSIFQINGLLKYDRNSCSKCRNYQYLSSFRCVDCKKNYCETDFQNCCNGNYELIYREPNNDRKWINTIINKSKKQFLS